MKAPFDYETAEQMFDYIAERLDGDECHGDLRYTEHWLRDVKHLDDAQVRDVIDFLESHGGYCDCEVLLNASDEGSWNHSCQKAQNL